MASAAGDDWATIVSKRSLAKFNRRGSTVTDFDRVIAISQPISNQTQIQQPSPAATERQPQRCTRSIPYCQRTIHDAPPWPASFRLPMLQANLSQDRTEKSKFRAVCVFRPAQAAASPQQPQPGIRRAEVATYQLSREFCSFPKTPTTAFGAWDCMLHQTQRPTAPRRGRHREHGSSRG